MGGAGGQWEHYRGRRQNLGRRRAWQLVLAGPRALAAQCSLQRHPSLIGATLASAPAAAPTAPELEVALVGDSGMGMGVCRAAMVRFQMGLWRAGVWVGVVLVITLIIN